MSSSLVGSSVKVYQRMRTVLLVAVCGIFYLSNTNSRLLLARLEGFFFGLHVSEAQNKGRAGKQQTKQKQNSCFFITETQ